MLKEFEDDLCESQLTGWHLTVICDEITIRNRIVRDAGNLREVGGILCTPR